MEAFKRILEMNEEYVSKLHEDLKKRLDGLCWTHNEPALRVAEHFAELRSQVDYDAEKQIEIFRGKDGEEAIAKVNGKRTAFIRILQELEKRIARQPKPEVGSSEIYASLEQRVETFKNPSCSLDELEDSYLQLAREITAVSDQLEQRLLGEQTIIYCPHKNVSKLGSLVYFSELFLSRRDIDHFLSAIFSNCKSRPFQSSARQLLVPTRELPKLNKCEQVFESLSNTKLRQFAKSSKFYCIRKTETECLDYAAEESAIDTEFISYEDKDTKILLIEGDVCLVTSASLFDVDSSRRCRLEIENSRLESLHANLLPPRASCLVQLSLAGLHFDSFDTTLLSQFTNLIELSVQATFSKDVKFDLESLKPLRKLNSLDLTLPGWSWDFSVFKELTELRDLQLESSSFFYAEKLPRLSKAILAQVLSAPRLEKLKLCCFDIETIDREMFNRCRWLDSFKLTRSRISDFHDQGAGGMNLGFPRLFEKQEDDGFKWHSFDDNFIKLIHSGIRVLNATSFVGMKNLQRLSLRGNLIAELPCGLFQNLPSLIRVELDKNLIRHIRGGVFGKLDRLCVLKLDGNPIETIEANAFAQLNNLIELSLNSCRLKSIDSEIFNGLLNLNKLNLSNNLIERIEVVAEDGRRINVAKANLSDEEKRLVKKHLFTDLSRLSTLQLGENKLKKLDLNCFSNLRKAGYLHLSSNLINELNGVAGPELLSSLILLDLDNNQLTAIDQSALPKSLYSLNLAENYLKRLDEDFFTELTKLHIVNLSENELTWTITEATFASCRHSVAIMDLSLNESIQVTEGAFRDMRVLNHLQCDFSGHFVSLPVLKTLRIRRLTQEVVRTLKKFCRDQQYRLRQLEALYLSGCSIKTFTRNPDWKSELDEKTPADLDHFNLNWFPKFTGLKELDFSKNLIETLDDPELLTGFKSITKINLSGNQLSRIHRYIFKCLPCLETIDLSGNQLSNIDMGLFRHQANLRDLNLRSNSISCLNLARLFRVCPNLETLNIADNQLDDRSTAEQISSKSSCCLSTLILANNRLEKMDFVRHMSTLKHLDLRGNQIESVMSRTGENLLGRLRELTHLDLSENKINQMTDEMFTYLHDTLKYLDISGNPSLESFKLDSVLSELI